MPTHIQLTVQRARGLLTKGKHGEFSISIQSHQKSPHRESVYKLKLILGFTDEGINPARLSD